MSAAYGSTLADMRTMFRSLTAQPTTLEISDERVDFYINNYYIFDLPSKYKLLNLSTTYTFYTQPYVDTYAFDRQTYYSINQPVYFAGVQSNYMQDRQNFFNYWPKIAYKQQFGIGNGSTITFNFITGYSPVIRSIGRFPTAPFNSIQSYEQFKEVIVTSQDSDGKNLIMVDIPSVTGNVNIGWLYPQGTTPPVTTPVDPSGNPNNYINYVTGELVVTFTSAPQSGANVEVQYTPFAAGRPQTLLYYDDYLTVRPIPDDIYEVVLNASIRPTALLSTAPQSTPYLEQWWQLLALGAAKNWFRDNLAVEEWKKLQEFYEEQLGYVDNRTLAQMGKERTSTIFTDSKWIPFGLFPPYL